MILKKYTKQELEDLYKIQPMNWPLPKTKTGYVQSTAIMPVILGLEHGITFGEPAHYEELRRTSLGKELF